MFITHTVLQGSDLLIRMELLIAGSVFIDCLVLSEDRAGPHNPEGERGRIEPGSYYRLDVQA